MTNLKWYETPSDYGLREHGQASDFLTHIRHTGWFVDSHQEETVSGYVFHLPGKHGKCRFVAAISDAYNIGTFGFDLSQVFDTEREAAMRADDEAEHYAAMSRECDEAYQAARSIEEMRDDNANTRRDALALFRDIKAARGNGMADYTAICGELRASLLAYRQECLANYRKINELADIWGSHDGFINA